MDKNNTINLDKETAAYFSSKLWSEFVPSFEENRVNSIKMMMLFLSKVNPLDSADEIANKFYTARYSEICEAFGYYGMSRSRTILFTFETMTNGNIGIDTEDIFRVVKVVDANESFVDKRNKIVMVKFNQKIIPYISNLKQYMKIKTNLVSATKKAFMFYCALKSIHNKTIKNLSFDKLLHLCGLGEMPFRLYKNKYLNPVIKELYDKYNIKITYEENRDYHNLYSLNFFIDEPEILAADKITKEEILETTFTVSKSEEVKEVVSKVSKTNQDSDLKDIQDVYKHYIKVFNKSENTYKLTEKRKAKIRARLKEFSKENLITAIDNMSNDDWPERYKFNDIDEHLFRSTEQTEKWINFNKAQAKPVSNTVPREKPKNKYPFSLDEDIYQWHIDRNIPVEHLPQKILDLINNQRQQKGLELIYAE